jgi:hypothetical protein
MNWLAFVLAVIWPLFQTTPISELASCQDSQSTVADSQNTPPPDKPNATAAVDPWGAI